MNEVTEKVKALKKFFKLLSKRRKRSRLAPVLSALTFPLVCGCEARKPKKKGKARKGKKKAKKRTKKRKK